MTEAKQQELVKLQRKILNTVWSYVKVGGTLIYSTCTIGADENQYNVKWFLENYPFRLESIETNIPAVFLSRCMLTQLPTTLTIIRSSSPFRLKR